MIKLTHILLEALQDDAQKGQKVNAYINKIKSLINSYRSDNKEIRVVGVGAFSYIEINLGNITVELIPKNNGNTHASFIPNKGDKPSIEIYNVKINRDPKLTATFDEKSLYHEFIHFLDFGGAKTDSSTLVKNKNRSVEKKGFSGYINDPLEVNAHFFEFFMPEVMKFIQKEKEIPKSFDEFKDGLLQDPKAKQFIKDLDDKNKKKILKRLGSYYTGILTNPKIDLEKDGEIDDSKLKRMTNSFISKLKNALKAA